MSSSKPPWIREIVTVRGLTQKMKGQTTLKGRGLQAQETLLQQNNIYENMQIYTNMYICIIFTKILGTCQRREYYPHLGIFLKVKFTGLD